MLSVWQVTLAVFAVLTMFGGNLMALLQNDLKRLLAFSTVAQTGYIIFGLAIATEYGLTGSLFHIMNHAIMKSLLFFCAGAFLRQAGTRDLTKLRGIRHTMPVTSLIFSIGAIAISGVPPLNGFWSEWMIVVAGLRAEMILFSVLMFANMILSVVYYLRVIEIIFLEKPTAVAEKATEAPASMLIPTLALVCLCIVIGVYPGPFITMASRAAQAALDFQAYIGSML